MRFRLRTLMIVVTLLSVACAVYLPELRREQEQAERAKQREAFAIEHSQYRFEFQFNSDKRICTFVAMPITASIDDRKQVATVFPEARILAINPDYRPPAPPPPPAPPVEYRSGGQHKWGPAPIEWCEYIEFPGENHATIGSLRPRHVE